MYVAVHIPHSRSRHKGHRHKRKHNHRHGNGHGNGHDRHRDGSSEDGVGVGGLEAQENQEDTHNGSGGSIGEAGASGGRVLNTSGLSGGGQGQETWSHPSYGKSISLPVGYLSVPEPDAAVLGMCALCVHLSLND